MAVRVELREISNEEGNLLLRMIRRTNGSIVTWRRAQIVLLAAQPIPPTKIAQVVFSDPDTVRQVIHSFNRDGFDALYPRYRGGRPRTFTLPQRQQIKRIALSVPSRRLIRGLSPTASRSGGRPESGRGGEDVAGAGRQGSGDRTASDGGLQIPGGAEADPQRLA
jgi:hypothetical protein